MGDGLERAPKQIEKGSPLHEQQAFQEGPGEAEADAVRIALLAHSGGDPVDAPAKQVHLDGATRTRVLNQMQQAHGNWFVRRMIDSGPSALSVRRQAQAPQPAAPTTTPSLQEGGADNTASSNTWVMPFQLGTATNLAEAKLGLVKIWGKLGDLDDWVDEKDGQSLESYKKQILALTNLPDGPISTTDRAMLSGRGTEIQTFYDQAVEHAGARLGAALGTIQSSDTSGVDADFAEALHREFLQPNPDTTRIAKLKKALGALDGYKKNADDIVGYCQKGANLLKSAKTAEALSKVKAGLGELGGVTKKGQQLCELAIDIQGMYTDNGGGGGGGMMGDVEKFAAALNAVDKVVGVLGKFVPGFSELWSNYYMKITQQIIVFMRQIAVVEERQGRMAAFLTWWNDSIKFGVPQIPPEDMSLFPGGQPVLDFMFRLMRGGSPSLDPGVQKFFMDRKDIFNAGEADKNQIDPGSESHWYDPTTWFKKDSSTNLAAWLVNNKQRVWAQLYGSLPPPGGG